MSTGIGNHEYSYISESPYGEPIAICPYCGYNDCHADWVDVGVGVVQAGPFVCKNCWASEASYLDEREMTEREEKTGWYEPNTHPSENANTVNGKVVDHKTAKLYYEMGLLDKKR